MSEIEPWIIALSSGLVGAILSQLLSIFVKNRLDRRKALRYIHAEVRDNIGIRELNIEVLTSEIEKSKTRGTYPIESPLLPFHTTAWESAKNGGYVTGLKHDLRKKLEETYLEMHYENLLITEPKSPQFVDAISSLKERMEELLDGELRLESLKAHIKKTLDC